MQNKAKCKRKQMQVRKTMQCKRKQMWVRKTMQIQKKTDACMQNDANVEENRCMHAKRGKCRRKQSGHAKQCKSASDMQIKQSGT